MTVPNPRGDLSRFPREAGPAPGPAFPVSLLDAGGTLPMELVVAAIVRLRDSFYPWIHILTKADGTVAVTILPPSGKR